MIRFVTALLLGWLALLPAAAAPGGAKTQVRLLLAENFARPGTTVMAGVELKMPPRVHTYWVNGGESGLPTEVAWKLPPGVTAGALQWPVPEKFEADGITTYGYHGTILLLAPLQLAADLKPGALAIQAKVSWLECEEMCIPGDAEVKATLTISAESKASPAAEQLAAAAKRLPQDGKALGISARWDGPATEKKRPLLVTWKPAAKLESADFLPYAGEGYEVGAATVFSAAAGNEAQLQLTVTRSGEQWPAQVSGVLLQRMPGEKEPQAHEVRLDLGGAGSESAIRNPQSAIPPAPASLGLLLQMLGLAFVGGLILNIMPCVFPVISLKILGFVHQSHDDPRRVLRMGLIYAVGVLVSFVVLAGLVIAAKSAGESASWGDQMQNPVFTLALTVVVLLVALNLFGVFEVTLGGGALNAASNLAAKEGPAGAFFNGVLAVALATPCTAPAMATAVGWAFTQPAPLILLTFLAVGLGLAFPYVLLSWKPAWLKLLPRPGAWMEHFKQAMGFPMLATVIWLFWFNADAYGSRGVLWLGMFLLSVALAAWVWGTFVQRGSQRRGLAAAISLLLLAGGYGYALEKELNWRHPAPPSTSGDVVETWSGGTVIRRWSAEAVAKTRAEGRIVLVDFTAKWCVTCQANKATSLEVAAVEARLKELNAVVLLGDFTRKDPLIAEELQRFQRAGVPLVLVYPRAAAQPPIVLPALLTPGIMLDALNAAAK
jgi:thiol:disulfide interchange protein